jgi:hypothetical protein
MVYSTIQHLPPPQPPPYSYTLSVYTEPEFLNVYGARNRFQWINSASLWSSAGRYYNPIPTRFLGKIPALYVYFGKGGGRVGGGQREGRGTTIH